MYIHLPDPRTPPSIVKRGALAAFRLVRRVQSSVRAVPGAIAATGRDVVDAWRETARPNA